MHQSTPFQAKKNFFWGVDIAPRPISGGPNLSPQTKPPGCPRLSRRIPSRSAPIGALNLRVQNKRLAIINVGAPSCGMNAAMRAFVRMVVTHKFKALAVNQGFQGLLHDEVGDL